MDDTFRWQAFFQHAAQPIFLVNRRRRVLFVNRAWEACTGLKLADVRGRACRRQSAAAAAEKEDAILAACAPPADALQGRQCSARRRAPLGAGWWEIAFQPLSGAGDLLGVLGTIRVLTGPTETPPPLPDRLMSLRDRQAARYRLDDYHADSPGLARVLEQARLAASTRVPSALVGEPGTGKEWLARAIHARSEWRQQPFASLDAARLPAALLGETLFGPRCRSLGLGTVFLRQPERLPREWQARLAETLASADNPDFPRLIIGYVRDPAADIAAGNLLAQLHCAASTITITLPPLRERRDHLPRFIEIFLERMRAGGGNVRSVGSEAMSVLRGYAWPGNLAELQAVLRAAGRRAKAERIELADLPYYLKQAPTAPDRHLPLDAILEQVERRLIVLALKLAQNNQTRAAELLEVWRPRLLRRMEKFGIPG